MKKIITTFLAISMLAAMSTTAFAADINQDTTLPTNKGTTVTYTVAPTYTVTIPESVTLSKQTAGSYAGSGEISTSAVRLNKYDGIFVSINSDFIMETAQGATQGYTATVDGETTALTDGKTCALFETSETAQSVTLHFAAENPKYAGGYSDTVTFNIAVDSVTVD